MSDYRHHVSGFFVHRAQAEEALSALVQRGLPRERLQIMAADKAPPAPVPSSSSNAVLKDVLVDGAIGTAVGTSIGALAQVALVAGSVSLFVASPLVAPLAMLGWGASLGGLVGAAVGAQSKEGGISALIGDAMASGQTVLVAETRTEQETSIASEVMKASVGDCEDVSAA